MKRMLLLMAAAMTFTLIVAGGVALAASFTSCPGSGQNCYGTNSDDKLKGDDSDEYIFAEGGNDTVDGNGSSDKLLGDGTEYGTPNPTLDGNDKLDGGAGIDLLIGYGGSDTLIGGSGDDVIDAISYESSGSQNTIRGGSGDDEIRADNGVRDTIDCGSGGEVYGDRADVDAGLDKLAKNCEDVRRV